MSEQLNLFGESEAVKSRRVKAVPGALIPTRRGFAEALRGGGARQFKLSSSVALGRIRKIVPKYSKKRFYQAVRRGDILAVKTTNTCRRDGRATNASFWICEESLERFLGRLDF